MLCKPRSPYWNGSLQNSSQRPGRNKEGEWRSQRSRKEAADNSFLQTVQFSLAQKQKGLVLRKLGSDKVLLFLNIHLSPFPFCYKECKTNLLLKHKTTTTSVCGRLRQSSLLKELSPIPAQPRITYYLDLTTQSTSHQHSMRWYLWLGTASFSSSHSREYTFASMGSVLFVLFVSMGFVLFVLAWDTNMLTLVM